MVYLHLNPIYSEFRNNIVLVSILKKYYLFGILVKVLFLGRCPSG